MGVWRGPAHLPWGGGGDTLAAKLLCMLSFLAGAHQLPHYAGPTSSFPWLSPCGRSVPQAVIDQLSPAWTARLPIVICSRCGVGRSCDDFLYRGSRQKYESRGFVLGGAYEHAGPLQARSLLVLRLAAFVRA